MSDYDMSGILFPNDRKTKDKQPDYWGNLIMNGIEYRLAGWKKEGQKGPFLTLKVSLPPGAPDKPTALTNPEFNDEITF